MNTSCTSRWLVVLGWLILAIGCEAWAIPMSTFVVHCEPTRANSMMWNELVDLVMLADSFDVPLTIDFSAQWASMILEDEAKIDLLELWLAAGHEIGCHHHGYWGTKDRGSTWDGYTNTPLAQIDPADRNRFLGTMDVYMALLNALPGERISGCLGTSSSGDDVDYVCQLTYSTRGQAIEEAVSVPASVNLNNCLVWEITHALIASLQRDVLRESYCATADTSVFAVVGHVYNFAAFSEPFEAWFSFLQTMDPQGNRRGTVAQILQEVEVSTDE